MEGKKPNVWESLGCLILSIGLLVLTVVVIRWQNPFLVIILVFFAYFLGMVVLNYLKSFYPGYIRDFPHLPRGFIRLRNDPYQDSWLRFSLRDMEQGETVWCWPPLLDENQEVNQPKQPKGLTVIFKGRRLKPNTVKRYMEQYSIIQKLENEGISPDDIASHLKYKDSRSVRYIKEIAKQEKW